MEPTFDGFLTREVNGIQKAILPGGTLSVFGVFYGKEIVADVQIMAHDYEIHVLLQRRKYAGQFQRTNGTVCIVLRRNELDQAFEVSPISLNAYNKGYGIMSPEIGMFVRKLTPELLHQTLCDQFIEYDGQFTLN